MRFERQPLESQWQPFQEVQILVSERTTFYFDNNATTRVAPEVVEAMLPFLRDYLGQSLQRLPIRHQAGQAVEEAREKVAALIGAEPKEIIFTSCGTESDNAALQSALAHPARQAPILITTAVEHSAIIKHCEFLRKQGCDVTFLPVDADGLLDLHLLDKSIRPDTALVSVMWANNETGVIFPIEEIAAICRSKGVLFHTDATQAPGKMKMDVQELGVDFLTLSAHKLHAPKGIGLLYVKRTAQIPALSHRRRSRSAGSAAGRKTSPASSPSAARRNWPWPAWRTKTRACARCATAWKRQFCAPFPTPSATAPGEPRLPNTSNIAFDFVEAEAILLMLDQLGICASSGSACTTGSLNPSHVLTAMGLKPRARRGCVRFSLGFYNTAEEVDYLLTHLPGVIARLREASPAKPARRARPAAAGGGAARRHAHKR